jgi:hypothetical protein
MRLTGTKGILQSKTAVVGIILAIIGLFGLLGILPAVLTATVVNFALLVGGVLVVIFRSSAVTEVTGFLTTNLS